jgi:hypothetical protein
MKLKIGKRIFNIAADGFTALNGNFSLYIFSYEEKQEKQMLSFNWHKISITCFYTKSINMPLKEFLDDSFFLEIDQLKLYENFIWRFGSQYNSIIESIIDKRILILL